MSPGLSTSYYSTKTKYICHLFHAAQKLIIKSINRWNCSFPTKNQLVLFFVFFSKQSIKWLPRDYQESFYADLFQTKTFSIPPWAEETEVWLCEVKSRVTGWSLIPACLWENVRVQSISFMSFIWKTHIQGSKLHTERCCKAVDHATHTALELWQPYCTGKKNMLLFVSLHIRTWTTHLRNGF